MELFGSVLRWLGADTSLEALKSQQHMMTPKLISCAKANALLMSHTRHKGSFNINSIKAENDSHNF